MRITNAIVNQRTVSDTCARLTAKVDSLEKRMDDMDIKLQQLEVIMSNILTKLAAKAT